VEAKKRMSYTKAAGAASLAFPRRSMGTISPPPGARIGYGRPDFIAAGSQSGSLPGKQRRSLAFAGHML